MSDTFAVGDAVTWSSQAGGYETGKSGVVVAIVPIGVDVRSAIRKLDTRKYLKTGIRDMAGDRDHESYLVQIQGGKKPDAKPMLYWPRTQALRRMS